MLFDRAVLALWLVRWLAVFLRVIQETIGSDNGWEGDPHYRVPKAMFTPCNKQWQRVLTERQTGCGYLSFCSVCKSAHAVVYLPSSRTLNIYSKRLMKRQISLYIWGSIVSRDFQEYLCWHEYKCPPPCLSSFTILSGLPRRPAPICAKWISWPSLSALVRCCNETALSAHHLSAYRVSESVRSCEWPCWYIRFNSVR